jgi:hypothetical protein
LSGFLPAQRDLPIALFQKTLGDNDLPILNRAPSHDDNVFDFKRPLAQNERVRVSTSFNSSLSTLPLVSCLVA